jgi:hypothetical protein
MKLRNLVELIEPKIETMFNNLNVFCNVLHNSFYSNFWLKLWNNSKDSDEFARNVWLKAISAQ